MRGSAALATRPLDVDAPAAESLAPGEMRRLPYGGELLGAVRVRARYAALPLDAFDRAAEALEALEQAVYLHLLRLSVGEGRNWCRVAKRDLEARLRLSERRLLGTLDALVAKGFLKPLHRDNRGTLWRVYLPREAFGEKLGDEVLVGRAAGLSVVREGKSATATPTPTTTTTSTATPPATPPATPARARAIPRLATGAREPSAGDLARALAEARGSVDAAALAAAGREIAELLAEGHAPERVAACIETVRRRAARAAAKETA